MPRDPNELPEIVLAAAIAIAEAGMHRVGCSHLPEYVTNVIASNYGSVAAMNG